MHYIQHAGVLVLPSERTLGDYTHWVQASPGFPSDNDKQLKDEAKIDSIPEYQKYICLAFDEVRIKKDLVYDKNSSQIIGFVNLGNINNQLLEFERSQTGESQPRVATHMLVFMVRGLFSCLEFPYVQVPTSLSGELLFPIVWECVKHLEAIGFKAHTPDGVSSNRKFFKMHKSNQESLVSHTSHAEKWPVHILAAPGRPLLLVQRWEQLPSSRSLSCKEAEVGAHKAHQLLQNES